jgi:hypothetical protein
MTASELIEELEGVRKADGEISERLTKAVLEPFPGTAPEKWEAVMKLMEERTALIKRAQTLTTKKRKVDEAEATALLNYFVERMEVREGRAGSERWHRIAVLNAEIQEILANTPESAPFPETLKEKYGERRELINAELAAAESAMESVPVTVTPEPGYGSPAPLRPLRLCLESDGTASGTGLFDFESGRPVEGFVAAMVEVSYGQAVFVSAAVQIELYGLKIQNAITATNDPSLHFPDRVLIIEADKLPPEEGVGAVPLTPLDFSVKDTDGKEVDIAAFTFSYCPGEVPNDAITSKPEVALIITPVGDEYGG